MAAASSSRAFASVTCLLPWTTASFVKFCLA
jgi:hypothetical protein